MKEQSFIVGLKVWKKSSFQLTEKIYNHLQKQTLKRRIVLFKLCKENQRVQSKILEVSFPIEFRFETKIGCFVTRLYTFAHSYSSLHFLNLQWHQIYYPIVDTILSLLYLLFLRSRKTSTKCRDKNKKNPQCYHLGVASMTCTWKYCCI